MKSRGGHLLYAGCALCLVLAVAVPVLSWVLSAFGMRCNSLLSDEGWRWMFLRIPDAAFTHGMLSFVCLVVTYGAVRRCGVCYRRTLRHPGAVAVFAALVAVQASLLIAVAFYSESPLLSVTGTLSHSAYIHGAPFAACLALTLASLAFGAVSGSVRSVRHLVETLTYGISRYSGLLLLAFLMTLVLAQCRYVWG